MSGMLPVGVAKLAKDSFDPRGVAYSVPLVLSLRPDSVDIRFGSLPKL